MFKKDILFQDKIELGYFTAASYLIKRLKDGQIKNIIADVHGAEFYIKDGSDLREELCELFAGKVHKDDFTFYDGLIEIDSMADELEFSIDEIDLIHKLSEFIESKCNRTDWTTIIIYFTPLDTQGNK